MPNLYILQYSLDKGFRGAADDRQRPQPARAPVHSGGMEVPDNLTLLPLPPGSPKLNPVEYIWQFMPEYVNAK